MRVAEQVRVAAALQHRLQRLEQVAVFAAQVEEALARADRVGARRVMPSNTRSAWRVSSTRSLKVPGSPSSALQTT